MPAAAAESRSAPDDVVELRASERQFRAIFVEAGDPILLLDGTRRIVDANRAAASLFGIRDRALPGLVLDGFLTEGLDDLEAAWGEMLAFGEARREHRLHSVALGKRIVDCSYRARIHENRHLCIARDVTDRRRLEERLLQSEKVESVGRLAGGIAHDFNNLLTAILGYAELILGTRALERTVRADLEEILKAAQRATSLTQKLLAYGRKQVLMPRTVDLSRVVIDLREMLRRVIREDVMLIFDLSQEPTFVQVDPAQIEQVILNLVLNARDALPAGGAVRIEVAPVPAGAASLPDEARHQATAYVRLRVSDTGHGMSAEVREHAFEPFFTTKDVGKGTGLGLASVYGIVRQSHGFIALESEPGRGATFTMHFPAVHAPAADEHPAAPASRVTTGSETVLLVEDEPSVRRIAATALERHGYRVLQADTARAARELFAVHGRDVAVLVTDVVMPGMNGPDLAQHLVAARPGLKVILMSGHAAPSLAADMGRHVAFLQKPFHPGELAGAVRNLLARPRER